MVGIRRRRKSSASSDELIITTSSTSSKSSAILTDPLMSRPRISYARRKKADTKLMVWLEIFAAIAGIFVIYFTYYHFDLFHYHLTHHFAHHWDDPSAQHLLGHKLLANRRNTSGAFHWFRRSADKGNPHSAYNLAAGHLSGYKTDVKKGEVRELLKFAAKNGVSEAKTLFLELCRDKPNKHCDH
ncbi:uncharacterized protein LOC128966181 [Oppia nitens]|uniref:uncharacterized protein LOC128966181 n=1 Tax=Oppia nitens TaxID=1686743 RepID=UPI0023D9A375|nr:uncharacterized protein LOC128966181 [Oppia nitens]